jgi:hypothetical protein
MSAAEALIAGRESFARHHWRDACRLLQAADRESPLDAAERLLNSEISEYTEGDVMEIFGDTIAIVQLPSNKRH